MYKYLIIKTYNYNYIIIYCKMNELIKTLKTMKLMNISFSKINFDDIPLNQFQQDPDFPSKHYYSQYYDGCIRDALTISYLELPKHYYVVNITEQLKYYIETRVSDLTFSNIIQILSWEFEYFTNTTIEEMQYDAIDIGTWVCANQRNGWYYFDENYDMIDLILFKYEIICRINIYKDELLDKRDRMMLHPNWINKVLDLKNIRFEELDFEDL